MSFQSQVFLKYKGKNYELSFKFEDDKVLDLNFSPPLSNEISFNLSLSQTPKAIENSSLSFQEKLIALTLFTKALQGYDETPTTRIPKLACPCFKVSLSDLNFSAERYHPDIHSVDLKNYLYQEFPFASACSSCVPVVSSFARDFTAQDFRTSEWKGRTNVEWIKAIFLQLPEKLEIVDFFNGKLYVKGNISEQNLEEILQNYFSQSIKVYSTPTPD